MNLKEYLNCIQDKSQKNVHAPCIITNVQTSTDFYQNDVSIKNYKIRQKFKNFVFLD